MKKKIVRTVYGLVALVLGIAFVARFAGPSLLRLYLESGVGNCRQIPILCMGPTEEINNPALNKGYIAELVPYRFQNLEIYLPKGFNVVQEMIKKAYYKKYKRRDKGAVVYLLYKEPGYFVTLFPNLRQQGITDNYEFIGRMLRTRLNEVSDITGAFFLIMKGIFTPNLADQRDVKMAHFTVEDKRGFINYNTGGADNYFDCNIIDSKGAFFKVYIRDVGARLDLDKVFAIISTVAHPG